MMLLTTRLRLDQNGRPHIPGGVEVWKNLFVNHPHGKYDGKLTKAASSWKDPDDVIEALFALCRKAVENEPLKIFMTVSDLDRNRATPLAAATVDRLARQYRQFGPQYAIFNDAPSLSDKSILQFLDTADAINRIKDAMLRADAAGVMQGLVGIWRVMARDGSIPAAQADASFSALLAPFADMRNNRALFDAGRAGVKTLLEAAAVKPEQPQGGLIDLLVGKGSHADEEAHTQMVQEMMRILEAQRIISLDTLFALADHLESLARGERLNVALINRLASRVAEIQLPRASLSGVEKNAMAFGYWTDKHIESQRKLNLRSAIEKASGDKEKLADLRGQLAPDPARYAGGAQLRALRAAGGADPLHQSAVRAQPRFPGHPGLEPYVAEHGDVRDGLAVERRRPAGGVAGRAALRAGGGRAELPGAGADAGADLGRPGAADDPERQDSAVVARDAGADALGGAAHALRAGAAGGIGAGRGVAGAGAGCAGGAGAAGAHARGGAG